MMQKSLWGVSVVARGQRAALLANLLVEGLETAIVHRWVGGQLGKASVMMLKGAEVGWGFGGTTRLKLSTLYLNLLNLV